MEHGQATPPPPAGSVQGQSSVIQGLSGESTVPWAAHQLWIGAAGSREGQTAGSASLPNQVTAPQSGHMGALQSVGQVHVPSVCIWGGPEVPLKVCTHPTSITMAKGVTLNSK